MNDLTVFIESGILELYVMDQCAPAEKEEVERMSRLYPQVKEELDIISKALEQHDRTHAVTPSETVKPFVMASIDFIKRMKGGEPATFPPIIHAASLISDYDAWLNRPDLQPLAPEENITARLIGHTPQMTTAIVWIKKSTPPEIHTDELEQFLIVEGTCNIYIGEDVHSLQAGDVLAIPLHTTHRVQITSVLPCKVILQRIAA